MNQKQKAKLSQIYFNRVTYIGKNETQMRTISVLNAKGLIARTTSCADGSWWSITDKGRAALVIK